MVGVDNGGVGINNDDGSGVDNGDGGVNNYDDSGGC